MTMMNYVPGKTLNVPRVYAVDVDDTLNLPGAPHPGPINPQDLNYLMHQGNIVGIAGNHRIVFQFWPDWFKTICFFGGYPPPRKTQFLQEIKYSIQLGNPYITDFCMIGNEHGNPYVSSNVNDDGYARLAGWRFLSEWQFAKGAR